MRITKTIEQGNSKVELRAFYAKESIERVEIISRVKEGKVWCAGIELTARGLSILGFIDFLDYAGKTIGIDMLPAFKGIIEDCNAA